ncbi:apoptosis-resistant E3 ubiquitin protein ligase 1-like isoform X2 [Lineus longissimus]|uniref:apoptosis-resistant E3 ubiquitin protein ligase 1-like isoform X2 n=1 Tax=Lineus longissimus TaxID=88925 RepID=UPI002B4F6CBC
MSSAAKLCLLLFGVIAVVLLCVSNLSLLKDKRLFKEWCEQYDILHLEDVLASFGAGSLVEFPELRLNDNQRFRKLREDEMEQIEEAIDGLKERLIVEEWLTEVELHQFYERSRTHSGVKKLEDFLTMTETELYHVTNSLPSYITLRKAVKALRGEQIDVYKKALWQSKLNRSGKLGVTGTFTILVTVLAIIGSLFLMAMTSAQEAVDDYGARKATLFESFFGKALAPQYCTVQWNWKEPVMVGKTMSFTIKFYTKNGKPYPISDLDQVLVEITLGNLPVAITVKHGSEDPANINISTVTFAVHKSGVYKISVMIGARHIRGSPFEKTFKSGPIDPSKTCFVQHCSMVVCTKDLATSLYIEPRDEYGNLCTYDPSTDKPYQYEVKVVECGSKIACQSPLISFTYEVYNRRFVMDMKLSKEGCFSVTTAINGQRLKNGEFDAIVLSVNDAAVVKKNVSKRSHSLWYESRLLSKDLNGRDGKEGKDKVKKVYCYISPRQLIIKEFYLKIIPKRLFTIRVCPSTKFVFKGHNNLVDLPAFTVDDCCQLPIDLASKDTTLIAATYASFLLKNIGGSETFRDKQDFFYHEVRSLHSKRQHERTTITINRMNLLESSMKATKHFSTSDWCKNFEVTFTGEPGVDWGGLRREWFEIVCTNLFDPMGSGLFRRFVEDNQGLVHPNPHRRPFFKMKYYEFAGRIVGKCLYESALGGGYKQTVKAKFTRSFLAQVIGLRVNYRHFEQDDPDLFTTKIKYVLENDVEDMEMVFAEEQYSEGGQVEEVIDLIPNGSKVAVTNDNKLTYLDALAQYRLANSVKDEMEYFLKGLNDLVPDNLLSIFDENELELLMCGTGTYSIADLRQHHIISGNSQSFRKVVEWFWTVISGFTQEDMARLLQFTTGSSQLPPGGFTELSPKFQIAAAPMFGVLPTAHTCFNQLCLPDYESVQQLHRSLLIAINEGNQGFGLA